MGILELLGYVWLFLILMFVVGLLFGIFVENYLEDSNPLKKWWRKQIVDNDPEDENPWKNFGG